MIVLVSLFLLFTAAVPASSQTAYTFTTVNAPSAGTTALLGTVPISINSAGDATGIYFKTSDFPVAHGFLRTADGTITEFDDPNAGSGSTGQMGTFPLGINSAGVITGTYADNSKVRHGFVRAAGGTITEFEVAGAGTGAFQGTTAISINAAGEIAGAYSDSNKVYHGFVRASNGTITNFDVSGAVQTFPFSINAAGAVTGFYGDASGAYHGFVRAADGTITTFSDPAAGAGPNNGTASLSINSAGAVAGSYSNASSIQSDPLAYPHGFVRAANGTITNFDPPGASAVSGHFLGTFAASINIAGEIAGFYSDAGGVHHGFVRAADGTITSPIDAPGASTSGFFPGTACVSINDSGKITGAYTDSSGAVHGFVAKPVTLQSVVEDINISLSQGLINNRGVASSLQQQISAAMSAAARGNSRAARGSLTAFINYVRAQTGKHIDEAAAEVLLADANALLTQR